MKRITLFKMTLASSIALGELMTAVGCHVEHDDHSDRDHPVIRHDDQHDDYHNDNQDNHHDNHQQDEPGNH